MSEPARDQSYVLPRDPDVGYLDYSRWIPLSKLEELERRRLEALSTFLIPAAGSDATVGGLIPRPVYRKTSHHLILPRYGPRVDGWGINWPVVVVRPKTRRVDYHSWIKLDYRGTTYQKQALTAWMSAGHGVLNLACGKGKTVIALEAIARSHTTAAVIVHTKSLLQQWIERIEQFLPGTKIGVVDANRNDWQGRDIVIMSMQTLMRHHQEVTPAFRTYFGTIIWDEVHHIPAEKFSVTADMFLGRRYGLSATVSRADGMEILLNYHVGPVFYSDLQQLIVPKTWVVPIHIDYQLEHYRRALSDLVGGQFNIPKLRGFITANEHRLMLEYQLYTRLLEAGRKTLVLSHSVNHLKRLKEMFENRAGLCIGEITDGATRHFQLTSFDLVFGTTQLAREGLDRPDFDTLVLSTPFGSGVSGQNNLQQSMGRILRPLPGKKPLLIILDDLRVKPLHRMVNGLVKMLKTWPKEMGGPLSVSFANSVDDIPL